MTQQPTSVRTPQYALIEVRGQYFAVEYTNPAVIERYVSRRRVTVYDWHGDPDNSDARLCTLAEIDQYL